MNTAELMLPADMQEMNETQFSPVYVDRMIRDAIESDMKNLTKVAKGVKLINEWLYADYYDSKKARLAQINELALHDLVMDVYTHIAYYQQPELFVSCTAQLAYKLGFDDHRDSITTVAEIVGLLCQTDAYDIVKENPQAQLKIVNRLAMPKSVVDAIDRSIFMPPMVSEPRDLRSNFESPYFSFNDCVILGRGNEHAEDVCLDVINTQNQVALSLDVEFLSSVEEQPTHEIDTAEKKRQWDVFKRQSYFIYNMLVKQGNRFWLVNKVDKRGRLYPHGYHVTTQGTPFKKAMIEFADKEVVTDVLPEINQ